MKRSYILGMAAILLVALSTSCGESRFKITGEVADAAGQSLLLEKSDFHGRWIAVDSTRIGKSGSFSISSEAPASPEIYRLSLGDRFIYLPIDSIETLQLKTSASAFGSDFSLTGSPDAELLAAFEKDVMTLQSPDSAALAQFKKNVYTKYIKESRGSIVSYYVLTKIIGDKPLYDPTDAADAKYYAAVATQFENFRPNDPHGNMVKDAALKAMRSHNSAQGKQTVMEATELRVIDIDLPNEKGENVKLSEVVGKGKPVVVIFSQMRDEKSPEFNRELNRIYAAKKGGVEFYHVSFDADTYGWREAASNLPWVTVHDPQGFSSTAIRDYNVTALPAVFIYNAAGDLIDRPESLSDLSKKL